MGKEKRLFLLAVMTVMMSTAGYSEVIQIGAGDNKTITDTLQLVYLKKNQLKYLMKQI